MILDDDYGTFQFRFNRKCQYEYGNVTDLDSILNSMIKFFEASGATAIALSQGGDFIGGEESTTAEMVRLSRKCMNSFLCSVERPFQFFGRLNCDVNAYVRLGNIGKLFFTTNQVSLCQKETQSNAGGMTDIYLTFGTYVKSFYSVMCQPSSVKVKMLRDRSSRIHHGINWRRTVPRILSEQWKKQDSLGAIKREVYANAR
jgi:hypothetical protein